MTFPKCDNQTRQQKFRNRRKLRNRNLKARNVNAKNLNSNYKKPKQTNI